MTLFLGLAIGLVVAVVVIVALAERGQRLAWTAIRRSRLSAPATSDTPAFL